MFRPTTVVELRSRFVNKNYKTNLRNHVENLKGGSGNLTVTHTFNCQFLQFNAIPESLEAKNMRAKDLWGIPEPKMLRDISMLSYFGQCCPNAGK